MSQTTTRADQVAPVPLASPLEAELREARRQAVDALMDAEDLERRARRARRRATGRLRRYENLLLEHGGQLTLPYEERS